MQHSPSSLISYLRSISDLVKAAAFFFFFSLFFSHFDMAVMAGASAQFVLFLRPDGD